MNTDEELNYISFVPKLKELYPALYNHIFDNGWSTSQCVVRFINERQIQIPDGESDIYYQDVMDYIIANEDKHTWWML